MTEHRDLERRIVATLDAGCSTLPPHLQQRLDRARRAALAAPQARRRWILLAPALAATLALTAALLVLSSAPTPKPPPMTADLDVLTDPRFELVLEDPDFIAWLAGLEAGEAQRQEQSETQG